MRGIKQKIKLIGIGVVIVTVVVVFYLSFQKKNPTQTSTPLAITSTIPTEGASGVSVFDPIKITFNQKADPLTITALSDPAEKWTYSQNSPNTITLEHKQYLKVFTNYKLTIMQHGNPIGTLVFETSQEQNDPRHLQSLESDLDKNYPLISLTPYETSRYRVVYSAPLTLEIDLKVSADDKGVVSEVQLWVKSRGIDPATHEYLVVAPPTP